MTRKIKTAALIFAAAVLFVFAVSCTEAEADGTDTNADTTDGEYMTLTGRVVKTDCVLFFIFDGSALYSENQIAIMYSRSDDVDFDDYLTGDTVKIVMSDVLECSPMQMGVYSIELLERGCADDVDESVYSEIESSGYIVEK
ncbi:MAG: hypothetical protein LUI61_03155 [Firmicutes bacterium]|nr:hypothetical protein [Bacillota bacterium]